MTEVEVIPVDEFRLAAIPAGTRQRLHLQVAYNPDGSPLILPALCVRGRAEGPTLIATGAVHGDEFEGPLAVQDVYTALDPAAMRGSFLGIPVANPTAFGAGTREGGADHLDMARVFPGSAGGAPTQRLAWALTHHILPQGDFLLDLHSAGDRNQIKEFCGYMMADGAVQETQRRAAIAFGLDMVWGTGALPGRSLSAAAELKLPAIYVEMRGEGRGRRDQVATAQAGVLQVAACLGIIEREFPTRPPVWFHETRESGSGHLQVQATARDGGLFVPEVEVWQSVAAGDLLGVVRHTDGRVLDRVTSTLAGRVLFLRTFPRVYAGDALAYVVEEPALEPSTDSSPAPVAN